MGFNSAFKGLIIQHPKHTRRIILLAVARLVQSYFATSH